MTNKELMVLALVVYVAYRYQRSHSGTSAVDKVYATEANTFATMDGTNFINSVWDSTNGQPGYMFGTVPAPGGLAVTPGQPQYSSIFGHM
ncbi:hypothetical protein [Paraburkholderia saeva]|uniref:Uncharacterized protein n=1 Tax=Paraburkholderia saeva TaxID=2777537 RepID=A0A9N8S2E1_9BURK|nr:hypothetical protein [Paraburkholderia saeva]CAG4928245.1 hypothetical protein LMG31841_05794 [Paraburkholderia saeva]